MAKLVISLSIDQKHLHWLQDMADKYNLPTADKALRIVILFAKGAKESGNSIFKDINVPPANNKVTSKHAIDKVLSQPKAQGNGYNRHICCVACPLDDRVSEYRYRHEDYLEEVVEKYKLASKDEAVQIILEYAVSRIDEKILFEVKRCKHGDTCKHC